MGQRDILDSFGVDAEDEDAVSHFITKETSAAKAFLAESRKRDV